MRFIYTLIFYIAIPFILMRLWWRGIAAPAYRKRWRERFGFVPILKMNKKVVWVHTVSLGEFIAALPLVRELLRNADLQLVITTTTPTGSERVKASLGDSVFHVYAPYDIPSVLNRFFSRINPEILIVMETELWPNLLAQCQQKGVPSILLNGRMSERSAKGYGRFHRLTKPMLSALNIALIQHADDAHRLINLGLEQKKIIITGNIKFDIAIQDTVRKEAQQLKAQWTQDEKIIWIAASTHQGEDEIILDAFSRVKDKVRLVLVPRHPERFASVADLCRGHHYNVCQRSDGKFIPGCDIILGDTLGELMLLFGASDIAFIGGSLVPRGGHNFIEAAAWQLPLQSGEHLFNFTEVSRLLAAAGALAITQSADDLVEDIKKLVNDTQVRTQRGKAALQVAMDNRGALQKSLDVINQYL